MSTTAKARWQQDKSLAGALGDEGAAEYRRLLRVVRSARGRFALFPIESDLPAAQRDALLAQLAADLADEGCCARRITLTRAEWDLFAHPDHPETFAPFDVAIVVGLEDTPNIVAVTGEPPVRPPAIALLNQSREALRKRVGVPLLLWCNPRAYTALLEFAPDFFDHFIAQFRFFNQVRTVAEGRGAGTNGATTTLSQTKRIATSNLLPSSPTELAFYEELVAKRTHGTPDYARALVGLAGSLLRWTSGDREANLRRAIACLEEALTIFSEDKFPQDWAMTQNDLGIAYGESAFIKDNEHNLKQAITCYEAALNVYKQDKFSQDWAGTQNNLGAAYRNLASVRDKEANLGKAVASYEAALLEHTRERFPAQFAMTQYNLGNTYSDLASVRDKEANLGKAVASYEAALLEFTRERFPLDWAMNQNNLGIAYWNLASVRDKEANLGKAVASYEAALLEFTRERFPLDWAMTQINLGIAYFDGENYEAARDVWLAAAQVYRAVEWGQERARALEANAQRCDQLLDARRFADSVGPHKDTLAPNGQDGENGESTSLAETTEDAPDAL